MARRKINEIPGQEALFVGGAATGAYGDRIESTWQEIEANPLLKSPFLMSDPSVPSIDIQARAEQLLSAATNQGYANQRALGLADAVKIEPHATEIWGRLKGRTTRTVEGAQRNANFYTAEAKRQFWAATGLTALIAADMMTREEAQALARVWYRHFDKRFSGDNKPKQKAALKRQITAQKKLKKRQAAHNQQAA